MQYTDEIKKEYESAKDYNFQEDIYDFINGKYGQDMNNTKENVLNFIETWEFKSIDEWYKEEGE